MIRKMRNCWKAGMGAMLICVAGMGAARADCGSVPFYAAALNPIEIIADGASLFVDGVEVIANAPTGIRHVNFDPLKVSIFEPRQRALILWNGEEEILLLSTDQRATERSAVLEVIPLPSRPTVSLGEFETFEKAQALAVNKRMWAVAHGGARADAARLPADAGRIHFEEKLGAHNLAVAEVIDGEKFTAFVQQYLQDRYQTTDTPIRPEFVKIIESYIAEGFQWFAFDVIALTDQTQSRQPIEYRFKSDCVFYPMRISKLERGKTEVDLLVFTPDGASTFEGLPASELRPQKQVDVNRSEVEELSARWSGFYGGEASTLVMDQFTIKGDIQKFTSDVRVK